MKSHPLAAARLRFPRAAYLDLTPGRTLSFVNMASLYQVLALPDDQRRDVEFYCDGFLLIGLLRLFSAFRLPRLPRVSFDFTSIAPAVFSQCQQAGLGLYIVGAREAELTAFLAKITTHYPGLTLVGARSGHLPRTAWAATCQAIAASPARVLLVGMGGGLQEQFIAQARAAGFTGTALTCGGFITQTAASAALHYYPAWINRLHLRFLYRMLREPHTVRRYLLDYPRNAARLARDLVTRRLCLDLSGPPVAAPPASWAPGAASGLP